MPASIKRQMYKLLIFMLLFSLLQYKDVSTNSCTKCVLGHKRFHPLQIFIIKPRVLWSSLAHRHSLQFSNALKNRQLRFQHSMKCKIHLRVESTLQPFLSGFERFVFYGIVSLEKEKGGDYYLKWEQWSSCCFEYGFLNLVCSIITTRTLQRYGFLLHQFH